MKKYFIVVLSGLLLLTLSACSTPYYGEYTYRDFVHLEHWDEIDDLGFDSIDLVYYYNRDFLGTSCTGCEVVQEEVFKYGMENTEGVTLYLINEREIQGTRPLGLRSQPRLFLVEEGIVTDNVLGAIPILEWMDQITSGEYVFPETKKPLTYDSYTHFTLDNIESYGYEEPVYVYFYSVHCGACALLKEDVLSFIRDYEETLSLYLLDYADRVNVENLPEVVPALLVIEDGRIEAVHKGIPAVQLLIEQLMFRNPLN